MKMEYNLRVPEIKSIQNHPCFNVSSSHLWGRIHLPIAKDCNIKCSYCNRKYPCFNENRPGTSGFILKSEQVLSYLNKVLNKRSYISVIGIAGPGDSMCAPEKTIDIIRKVHSLYPSLLICLSTNGLNLYEYIDDLVISGVTHITVTINAINPKIGGQIYEMAFFDNRVFYKEDAAELIISRQIRAIKKLKKHNIKVKVNTVAIPDVNWDHICDIAKTVGKLGADIMNIIPLIPLEETIFEGIKDIEKRELNSLRKEAELYIKQMYHCRRCRADSIGLLKNDEINEVLKNEISYLCYLPLLDIKP